MTFVQRMIERFGFWICYLAVVIAFFIGMIAVPAVLSWIICLIAYLLTIIP